MQDFKFATLFDEVRPSIKDPWGLGIEIFYRGSSHPAVMEWEKERQRQNPLSREILLIQANSLGSGMIKALGEGLQGDALQDRAEELGKEIRQQRCDERAAEFNLTPEQVDRLYGFQGQAERAAIMADGWEGVKDENGEDVPFSQDAALAFFTQGTIIPQGEPHAGQLLAIVLAEKVIDGSQLLGAAQLSARGTVKKGLPASTGANSPEGAKSSDAR